MTECHHCGIVYAVEVHEDYDDAEVEYCPFCGEDVHELDELDFQE